MDVPGCPCCVPSVCIGLLVAAFGVASAGSALGAGRAWRVVSRGLGGVVALIAIFLALLANSQPLRELSFAKLCVALTSGSGLDETRCTQLGLSGLHGKVLEFGPGPGTNFRCWPQAPIDWVGVEPNTRFAEAQDAEAAKRNASFPRRSVWLKGEDAAEAGAVDVPANSFDHAVLTHVLCSVEDPEAVLQQAYRALKPGGQVHVLEHIAAPEGSWLRAVQQAFAPILFIVGNGCQFRHTDETLQSSQFADLRLDLIDAPMPIPFLRPHALAVGTK